MSHIHQVADHLELTEKAQWLVEGARAGMISKVHELDGQL